MPCSKSSNTLHLCFYKQSAVASQITSMTNPFTIATIPRLSSPSHLNRWTHIHLNLTRLRVNLIQLHPFTYQIPPSSPPHTPFSFRDVWYPSSRPWTTGKSEFCKPRTIGIHSLSPPKLVYFKAGTLQLLYWNVFPQTVLVPTDRFRWPHFLIMTLSRYRNSVQIIQHLSDALIPPCPFLRYRAASSLISISISTST